MHFLLFHPWSLETSEERLQLRTLAIWKQKGSQNEQIQTIVVVYLILISI